VPNKIVTTEARASVEQGIVIARNPEVSGRRSDLFAGNQAGA